MAHTKRLPWNLILGLGIPALVFGVILFSAIGFLLLRVYDSERLHHAAARGDLAEVRDLLDREPWRLDKRNRGDMTPLHMASYRDQGAVIKELARHGADINARWNQVASDDGDWTALHIAARRGKPEIVAALLKVGADPNVRTRRGQTPQDIATESGHAAASAVLRDHGGR